MRKRVLDRLVALGQGPLPSIDDFTMYARLIRFPPRRDEAVSFDPIGVIDERNYVVFNPVRGLRNTVWWGGPKPLVPGPILVFFSFEVRRGMISNKNQLRYGLFEIETKRR